MRKTSLKTPSTLQTLLTQSYEAEKNLRHFSLVASSELNTLLASVLGELETALSLKNTHPTDSIQSAMKAAERAVFLSRNIRYFSGVNSSHRELTDLSQLILDVINRVEDAFQLRNIQFQAQIENSVFAIIDSVAFEQAVLNLLWFGAHQLPEGGKAVLSLQVLPQGIQLAFSEDDSESTYQPFAVESLGADSMSVLGLHVSRSIVESHSGKFHCLKNSEQSLQFLFEMPFDSRLNKPHLYQEKRRFQRVTVNLPAEVTLSGKAPFRAQVSVLSVGGAFVAVSQDWMSFLKVDDTLSLKIFTESGTCIEIPQARVANLHPTGSYCGAGLEFKELEGKAKNLLAALVRTHAS